WASATAHLWVRWIAPSVPTRYPSPPGTSITTVTRRSDRQSGCEYGLCFLGEREWNISAASVFSHWYPASWDRGRRLQDRRKHRSGRSQRDLFQFSVWAGLGFRSPRKWEWHVPALCGLRYRSAAHATGRGRISGRRQARPGSYELLPRYRQT